MSKTSEPVYRPLGDHVLVRRDKAEDKSKGGILIPDSAQEKTRRGVVLAVGPGKLLEDGTRAKMELLEGDRVIFTRYAGNEVGDGKSEKEDELIAMHEYEVLAVVEKG